jgi:hypothetical protein
VNDLTTSNNNLANISDGYHTFGELYEHRHALMRALTFAYPEIAWRAPVGEHLEGWFLVGMSLPTGQISYHLPEKYYGAFEHCYPVSQPTWDGHTPQQVVERLHAWVDSRWTG